MSAAERPEPTLPSTPDDASPGLPGLRTWRAVYVFVGGTFLLWLVLLTLLTWWFT